MAFQNETEVLELLAERPFDAALRLVFADWLLEHGNVRGEVIVGARQEALPLSERRRLGRLVTAHQHDWLGPLAPLVDLARSVWVDGFLDDVTLLSSVTESMAQAVADDPRWATVRRLSFPMRFPLAPANGLLQSRRLAQLREVHGPPAFLMALSPVEFPSFALETIGVISWGVFEEELQSFGAWQQRSRGFDSAGQLKLTTSEFINGVSSAELRMHFQRHVDLKRFSHVQLSVQYGAIEGVARWLLLGDDREALERNLQLERWSIEYADAVFTLGRTQDNRFAALLADLRGHEGAVGLGQRIAALSTILVQLAPARLESVAVKLPERARLKPEERDALRAGLRRLGTVRKLMIDDLLTVP